MITAETTELHQLAKLPILFQHFAEHQQRDNSVSLMQFLAMHYWGDDMNDDDNDRDMQLPFKKIDSHSEQVYFMSTVRMISNTAYIQRLNPGLSEYRAEYFPDPALSALFRPPRA